MARQNLRNLLLFASLVFAAFLSESPRQHVEARTLQKREVESTTVEDTTTKFFTTEATFTTTEVQQIPTIVPTTPESITETTTEVNTSNESSSTSTESQSFTSPKNATRSLYDELKLASSAPTFTSPFGSMSTEFMKFENLKIEDDIKSDESIENKFKDDEFGFRNNETNIERHSMNEAKFDEETVKYSSKNLTKPEEDVKTTVVPTTVKKGKYLDLMPQGDDNMNTSIPNAAEVWALAGLKEFETRKPVENDESTENVTNMNDTVKNLLDWSEIAKMENDSMPQSSDESYKDLAATTVHNEINIDEDPATSENKGVNVFASVPPTTLPTLKPIIEDNRVEVETGNVEMHEGSKNNSQIATARIDSEVFAKSLEESEDAVELIEPLKKSETNQSLKIEEAAATTETSESITTEIPETTTTTEFFETTTSIVDSFTVIGEDDITDEVFKRTITELPPVTTTDLPTTTSPVVITTTTTTATTTSPRAVSMIETTTEVYSPTANEIPETTQRLIKTPAPTKPIVVLTTEKIDSTEDDSQKSPSTLIPKFFTTSQPVATTQIKTESSTSSPTVEIFDDDKFKYSTLLPEATTTAAYESKNEDFEESTTKKVGSFDAPNKETLDGDQAGSSNLGLISGIVSVVVLLVVGGVVYFVLKRRNNQKFSQRCRPVGLDAYSLDNVSVYNSVRRKPNALRMSKRSYGNSAFEDPSLQSNVLDYQSLQDFAKNKISIQDEFKEIPQVSVRVDEMPDNCEDKNRYANVVPLPETRVLLQKVGDDEKSEYINANFVKGPKDSTNYYIATQAPLENTVADFWRMIWEQNSKVIVMATDLTENGVERCAEYIPASMVVDNMLTFGDFQVTMKSREVKGKYAVSQLHLKNLKTNTWREIMHLWYSWPESGCPTDEASIISLLLEARGYLRTNMPEQLDENSNMESIDKEKLSTLDKTKSLQRVQGPLTLHCSPGTGRTGTLIACDIILRYLEIPPRQIDIPQIVYAVRRGRANAVRTKDQYEFIYTIANAYATKLNTAPAET